jgi:prolyl 4-hydroxylase
VGETLHPEPLIRRFADFAAPDICAWLIERARGGLSRATVYSQNPHDRHVSETRTNSIRLFNLVEHDLVQLVLQARMAAATGIPPSHMEAISVLHYAEGEQITEHFDFVSPDTPDHAQNLARYGERVVTFLVYLNDDYAGGETEFPRLELSHKGARGEGLFFTNALPSGAADVRSVHAGRPPRGGEKWIVSQFIRSRPFVPGASAG